MSLIIRMKIAFASCLCHMLFWTRVLPIKKNRILFFSFQGKSYSCNPKYILREKENGRNDFSEVELVWAFCDPNTYVGLNTHGIHVLEYGSLSFYYTFFTSHVVVTNASNLPYLPIKKKQLLMNTWHGGGAYKSESFDSALTHFRNRSVKVFLSSSKVFQEIMENSTGLSKKSFVPSGMPRNDVFFRLKPEDIQSKRKKLGLRSDTHYLLYAPTYRDDHVDYEKPDFTRILAALERRFGGQWTLLVRGHYNTESLFDSVSDTNMVDLSTYDDMQDILCVADVAITDYSSFIWDYSFLYRPCFLFVPDEARYQMMRGLYQPIEQWKFPFARTNEELVQCILTFDMEKNQMLLKEHQDDLGSFEKGRASETAAYCILKWMRDEA